jgi:lysophospholipase
MAWDDDVDDEPYAWNNGTNLYDSYTHAKEHGLPFPEIPPVTELLALNYTLKPVLFGCDTNLTTTRDATSPIVAYFANAPYSMYANYSWIETLAADEFDAVLENSFNLLTQGNGTLSDTWAQCLGCAAIDRSLGRIGIERPAFCEQCFEEHCWDGMLSGGVSDDFILDPSPALTPNVSYAEWSAEHPDW